MRALRIELSAWASSFRYGGFMAGIQPTLPMPPLSTVYGLISAATGSIVTPHDTFVSYTFQADGRAVDLERILEIDPGSGGSWNIIKRELLFSPRLTLYLDSEYASAFESPHYPLLLGRSSDLACVDSVERVVLDPIQSNETTVFGNGLYTSPPEGYRLAVMYALPVFFSDETPRKAIGTRPFYMVTETYHSKGNGIRDPEKGITMELFDAETLGLEGHNDDQSQEE